MEIPNAYTYILKDENVNELINKIRREHDPSFKKWSFPHINLFYPFVDYKIDETLLREHATQFYICFERIDFFKLGMTYYIYLKCNLESEQRLINIRNVLIASYPELEDRYQYRPYLILGQCYKPDLDACLDKFNKELYDIINKIYILGETFTFIPLNNMMTPIS